MTKALHWEEPYITLLDRLGDDKVVVFQVAVRGVGRLIWTHLGRAVWFGVRERRYRDTHLHGDGAHHNHQPPHPVEGDRHNAEQPLLLAVRHNVAVAEQERHQVAGKRQATVVHPEEVERCGDEPPQVGLGSEVAVADGQRSDFAPPVSVNQAPVLDVREQKNRDQPGDDVRQDHPARLTRHCDDETAHAARSCFRCPQQHRISHPFVTRRMTHKTIQRNYIFVNNTLLRLYAVFVV
jgi:hypothetical protein